MDEILKSPFVTLIFRMIVGTIFIYASIDKILHPADFAVAIQNYHILPESLTNITGIVLPWIEIWCGIFLITGVFSRGAVTLLGGLLAVFLLAMLSAKIRGLNIACGCFNVSDQTGQISFIDIFMNLILIAMSLHLIIYHSQKLKL